MHNKRLLDSFNFAIEGLIYVVKTQRHMRYHLMMAATALLFAIYSSPPFDIRELILLLLTITFVLVSEMVNTALEAVVDMVSPQYSALAKIAKDVAAGGVLLTTINALVVGYLLFFNRMRRMGPSLFEQADNVGVYIILIGVLLTVLIVVFAKVATRRGTPMQGGVISGHSAVSVFLASAIFLLSHGESMLISVAGICLALLVIQSRLETGVHTPVEVIGGSLVGLIMAFALFEFLA
ncbi:MAG: diacylglycerol kinase [bacterium]|nr:diacylglycerol kinase [bacterium]